MDHNHRPFMGIWAVSMIGFVVHASSMCRILRGFLIILFPALKNRHDSRLAILDPGCGLWRSRRSNLWPNTFTGYALFLRALTCFQCEINHIVSSCLTGCGICPKHKYQLQNVDDQCIPINFPSCSHRLLYVDSRGNSSELFVPGINHILFGIHRPHIGSMDGRTSHMRCSSRNTITTRRMDVLYMIFFCTSIQYY